MHETLKNCPFCGAAAHFEMDEGRWEWVECESCGMQGNRSASLMEDCKPKLVEAWNRRTPTPVGVEPVAWRVRMLDSPNYWIIFLHKPVDALMDPKREVQPLYTTPQPTQAQAGVPWQWVDEVRQYLTAAADSSMSRNNSEQLASELLEQVPTQAQAWAVPLNHKNIEPVRRFLADRGIYLSDETTKALITVSHGIKGGQHGADI